MPEYRLVKHREQWSLAYTEPGKGRVRIATGTDNRGEAEARAGQLWRNITQPKSERVADLWPIYVADRAGIVANAKRFDYMWKALEPHFSYKLGKSIARADCLAYTAKRRRDGRTNSTIRTELESLRACLRWHYGNEAPKIVAPTPSKPRERFLTKADREKLLATTTTPHVKLFLEIAMATGARAGAILDLTWDRVGTTIDFQPAGRDKTNKRRTVVGITPRLQAALDTAKKAALSDYVIEYGGKQVKSVKTALMAAARRSGVAFSAHDLRRSAARWMAEDGVPMEVIAQVLGHTSTRITIQHYARFSPGFMADAMKALDW